MADGFGEGSVTPGNAEPDIDAAAPVITGTRLPAASSIADGVEHELDPRSVALGRTIGWIVTGTIAAGSFVAIALALLASPLPLWAAAACVVGWASASAALGWWLHRWPEIEHRHKSYRVDEHGVEIRGGVVWRQVINVPRSRVQHTDVSQGPFERSYGLGTLSIFTAGTDHARVDLSGLDHATALAIRDHLLPRGGADAV